MASRQLGPILVRNSVISMNADAWLDTQVSRFSHNPVVGWLLFGAVRVSVGSCTAGLHLIPVGTSRQININAELTNVSLLVVAGLLTAYLFAADISSLLHAWSTQEEYSHGFLIPFIAAFLVYQRKNELAASGIAGSWWGVALLAAGCLLQLGGRAAVVSTMGQYALVFCIAGLFLALLGWHGFRRIWIAMFMLLFMVKLPTFVFNNLSSQLQLISSQIGVWFIRLFDISVYLEGNVIDLGEMKLQVVEACSGLRYLFPLMALSLILAIFYKASWWQKALIFLSSMPVTVLMNSFRIGAIGVTVEYWGKSMAEGFLHDFEGWFVFMAAFLVLFLEILLLNKLVGERRPFSEVLALELPSPIANGGLLQQQLPRQFLVAIALLLLFSIVGRLYSVGESILPERQSLVGFPMMVDGRIGTRSYLDSIYLKELQVDDYLMADYKGRGDQGINLYVAYYDVQAEGAGTIHSPRSCLPGSGWRIKSLTQESLPGIEMSGEPLVANKAVIVKGNQEVLVYYWMQQRGRIITNEFMAKWWILWDRITRHRSDGALVRVMMPLDSRGGLEASQIQLHRFISDIATDLPKFIPE